MERPRVLVVEDEFLVRDMIAHELARAGFAVLQATTAEEALALLAQTEPVELLFTDIKLPGMDGWRLAEEIRVRAPDVKVIYATGYAERAEPLPESRFLQKPYRPSEVLQAAAELGIKPPKTLPD